MEGMMVLEVDTEKMGFGKEFLSAMEFPEQLEPLGVSKEKLGKTWGSLGQWKVSLDGL